MIGHTTARTYLENALPTATLLVGPRSIGKWTLAQHLAEHHRVHPVDRWLVDHGLTISTVRLVASFAARAPHGDFKLVIARLDDAKRATLNAMLKTLEEPPPHVRFLFTASSRPISTVVSRCTTFELGELNCEELEHIYREQGYTQTRARRAATYAKGRVAAGYEADNAVSHRAQVITLAKAITGGDREQFTALFATWDGHSSDLLSTLLTECLTGRWRTFTEADAAGLHHDRRRLWQIVAALAKVRHARPRLGVRAALEPFLIRR